MVELTVSCYETSTDDSRGGIHPWFSDISGKLFFGTVLSIVDARLVVIKLVNSDFRVVI